VRMSLNGGERVRRGREVEHRFRLRYEGTNPTLVLRSSFVSPSEWPLRRAHSLKTAYGSSAPQMSFPFLDPIRLLVGAELGHPGYNGR
jgi:hypothetical protein